jgi:hypothetical protein
MSREILIYGHGDKSVTGFPKPESLIAYLEGGIFRDEDGRYRYSQMKSADVVILARDGSAFGHFEIDAAEAPTDADRKAYPAVKKVYLVRKSVRYGDRVRLSPLGISKYRFGKYVTEDQFEKILKLAGNSEEYRAQNIQKIAESINRSAVGRPIGSLQTLRQQVHGTARVPTHSIFDSRTIFPDYAFHVGGRSEIQFNIGTEEVGNEAEIRYGLGFSLEPSQSLPDIDVLVPKIARFNEYVRTYRADLSDLRMWHFRSGVRSEDYSPTEIPLEQVQPHVFIFIGSREPARSLEVNRIVDLFDRLLPMYEFVESKTVAFPAIMGRSGAFAFVPGCSVKASTTTASLPERTLDIQLRHNEMQRTLFDRLAKEFGAEYVGTETRNGSGARIDVVLRRGVSYWFYEIKTSLSARGCIREALPQLLEYAFWPGTQEAERLVVVGEAMLDEQSAEYLSRLRTRFGLPVYYEPLGSIERKR